MLAPSDVSHVTEEHLYSNGDPQQHSPGDTSSLDYIDKSASFTDIDAINSMTPDLPHRKRGKHVAKATSTSEIDNTSQEMGDTEVVPPDFDSHHTTRPPDGVSDPADSGPMSAADVQSTRVTSGSLPQSTRNTNQSSSTSCSNHGNTTSPHALNNSTPSGQHFHLTGNNTSSDISTNQMLPASQQEVDRITQVPRVNINQIPGYGSSNQSPTAIYENMSTPRRAQDRLPIYKSGQHVPV